MIVVFIFTLSLTGLCLKGASFLIFYTCVSYTIYDATLCYTCLPQSPSSHTPRPHTTRRARALLPAVVVPRDPKLGSLAAVRPAPRCGGQDGQAAAGGGDGYGIRGYATARGTGQPAPPHQVLTDTSLALPVHGIPTHSL